MGAHDLTGKSCLSRWGLSVAEQHSPSPPPPHLLGGCQEDGDTTHLYFPLLPQHPGTRPTAPPRSAPAQMGKQD